MAVARMRGCSVKQVLDGDEIELRLDVHALRCAEAGRMDAVSEVMQRADKDAMGIDVIAGLLSLLCREGAR